LTTYNRICIIFLSMTGIKSNRPSIIINWVARVVGLIVLVVFLVFLIGDIVNTIQEEGFEFDAESLFIVLPIVMALAGYILSWWHKIIGGSLLILVSIVFGVLVSVAARQNQGPMSDFHALEGWLILGLPFLVIGVLFLISAYLDRRAAS
jgi:hypothetical protein